MRGLRDHEAQVNVQPITPQLCSLSIHHCAEEDQRAASSSPGDGHEVGQIEESASATTRKHAKHMYTCMCTHQHTSLNAYINKASIHMHASVATVALFDKRHVEKASITTNKDW